MSKLSDILQQRLNDAVSAQNGILDNATPATFTPSVQKRVKELGDAIGELRGSLAAENARIEGEKRTAKLLSPGALAELNGRPAAGAGNDDDMVRRAANGLPAHDEDGRVYVLSEEPVYREDDARTNQTSFFRDLFNVTKGDFGAIERLHRNNQQMDMPGRQARALSTTAGAGGQFAPPLWLVAEFIKLARPARVTADLLRHEVMPQGVSSVNLPAVATGTTTAVQTTQNSDVSNTDMTTSSVSSGITTISGKQIVALQLLRQSPTPFDEVVLGDLAADYAKQLDQQVIFGTGASGQIKGLTGWGTTVTWTQGTPVVAGTTPAASFQAQITKVAAAVANTRFAPATALVMSPERWGWITEAVDSQGRPLVPPASSSGTMNAFGSANDPTAQGPAGTFAGLPVFVDPALTVASGNETALVLRPADSWLYEDELTMDAFEATYANQMSVLFRVYSFAALLGRYAASIQAMSGTGLIKVTLG